MCHYTHTTVFKELVWSHVQNAQKAFCTCDQMEEASFRTGLVASYVRNVFDGTGRSSSASEPILALRVLALFVQSLRDLEEDESNVQKQVVLRVRLAISVNTFAQDFTVYIGGRMPGSGSKSSSSPSLRSRPEVRTMQYHHKL